jgi:uncharacterized membrane protein
MLRLEKRESLSVGLALSLSSIVCVALYLGRFLMSQQAPFEFILWNLFLAWLPMLSALLATRVYRLRSRLTWPVILACAAAWLLFLPNAPYVVTDLSHLRARADAPYYYDLVLVASYAWTGCFLGLGSLLLMQRLVRQMVGAWASWAFVVCVVGLIGFGIYLGRVLRWNSWDVLVHPRSLLHDILLRVRHPFEYPQTIAFSLLFALFFFSLYLTLVALVHLAGDTQGRT